MRVVFNGIKFRIHHQGRGEFTVEGPGQRVETYQSSPNAYVDVLCAHLGEMGDKDVIDGITANVSRAEIEKQVEAALSAGYAMKPPSNSNPRLLSIRTADRGVGMRTAPAPPQQMSADRRAAVLKFIFENPGTPIGAGLNVGRDGRSARFHASTLRSMEADAVLVGRIGNDGHRWYSLAVQL